MDHMSLNPNLLEIEQQKAEALEKIARSMNNIERAVVGMEKPLSQTLQTVAAILNKLTR